MKYSLVPTIITLTIVLSSMSFSHPKHPDDLIKDLHLYETKPNRTLRFSGGIGRTFVKTSVGNGNKENYRFGLTHLVRKDEPSDNLYLESFIELGYSQI